MSHEGYAYYCGGGLIDITCLLFIVFMEPQIS
jgi:hypothetical protein